MNAYENKAAMAWMLENECAGLELEDGVDIESCPTTADEAAEYQAALFVGWYLMSGPTLEAECIGLDKEPGVDIDACPITLDEANSYQEDLFDEWYRACYERRLYRIDDYLKYAIFEHTYFYSLSQFEQKFYKDEYGKFCIIVPDFFFDWADTKRYKQEIGPMAQMWIDECGYKYCIDTAQGEGHILTQVGKDKVQHTTASYWLKDKKDIKLKMAIDQFAENIGRAMDKIPTKAKEKKGPGRPPKSAEPKEGSPQDIEDKRNGVMSYYKEVLGKRYRGYAGHDRNEIVRRVKEKKEACAVEMNNLERTGSLLPLINGLYDFKKEEFRSALPTDYISVYAPTRYDPEAKDENVDKFINQFVCDRADLRDFLAQVLGVGLDLNAITKTMCEMWGQTTNNGKSTIVKALVKCLGKGEENGLAQVLSNKFIGVPAKVSDDSAPTPSLAMIKYARLLFASEPERDMKINWSLVKQLTGGESYQSRQLYEGIQNKDARATLIIDTNHPLRVTDQTVFARGTIQVLPCDYKITASNIDYEIDAKLSTESAKSTLINFMIEGYKSYIKNGRKFCDPPCVQAALVKNKEKSDRIGCFIKENYIVGQALTNKVQLRPMWKEYTDWCTDNGYTHPEVYSTFCAYFESNVRAYPPGELHKQKAVCGLIKLTQSEEVHQIISGDPVDWYISEFMVEEPQSDGQQLDVDGNTVEPLTVKFETIYNDYKRKIIDAGGQPLELRQLYGELVFRGWNIVMGTPGDTSSITVTGWHLASKAEIKAKQEKKLEARAAEIRKGVKAALKNMDIEASAALQILMTYGINNLLNGVSDDVRRVIMDTVTTGVNREVVITAIAYE
ncbi:MAG: hypothetical protein K2M42_09315 [Oscillospiraceae bacterium]|nr:hypothetical protein [Oscillospiraceae bacterium]